MEVKPSSNTLLDRSESLGMNAVAVSKPIFKKSKPHEFSVNKETALCCLIDKDQASRGRYLNTAVGIDKHY